MLGPHQVVWLNDDRQWQRDGRAPAGHAPDDPDVLQLRSEAEILRLYGAARAVHAADDGVDRAVRAVPAVRLGARQVFVVDVDLVQTSCGYAVPLMDFVDERTVLDSWARKKGEDGLVAYQQEKNSRQPRRLPTGLPPR